MAKITEVVLEHEGEVVIETDAKHMTIQTRSGEIRLFMGDNHKTITSFVKDVKFTTWYSSNPKKTSKFKKADGQRMVILEGE